MTARTSSGRNDWRVACSWISGSNRSSSTTSSTRAGGHVPGRARDLVDVRRRIDRPVGEHQRAVGVAPCVDLRIGLGRPCPRRRGPMNRNARNRMRSHTSRGFQVLSAGEGTKLRNVVYKSRAVLAWAPERGRRGVLARVAAATAAGVAAAGVVSDSSVDWPGHRPLHRDAQHHRQRRSSTATSSTGTSPRRARTYEAERKVLTEDELRAFAEKAYPG